MSLRKRFHALKKSVNEAFGDKPPIAANVIDSKALAANETAWKSLPFESPVGGFNLELNEKCTA